MSSACDKILTEAGLDANDVQMVKKLSDDGVAPNKISDELLLEM